MTNEKKRKNTELPKLILKSAQYIILYEYIL